MTETLIFPNGVDAETGAPLLPPLPVETVAALAQGHPIAKAELDELRARVAVLENQRAAHMGVMAGVDSNDLAQAGWGVIFAAEDEAGLPALREALAPLLSLRRAQAGDLYRDETVNPDFCYQPGESMNTWRSRNGGAPGAVDPSRLPYYLLIVGDPQRIPFDFQYQLDVAHAVGRIHFDTLNEYHSYARSVAASEDAARPLALARSAAFFGARNQFDLATQLSAKHLVSPLADTLGQQLAGWQVQRWLERDASKAQLSRLLGGDSTPAFLFSAGHGMGFKFSENGNPRQRSEQGALICSDWPGAGPVQDGMRLSADDVPNDARLLGMIAFFFACYGAGTPQFDEFAIGARQQELLDSGAAVTGLEQHDRIPIAPRPFVARLPQRLLGHPKGGALAVVGHVDRAWGSSFIWEGAPQLATFESGLTRLLGGARLGPAVEDFNNRYAELSTQLTARVQAIKFKEIVPPEELAGLWTANNDARSYVILGDPAVKLAVAAAEAPSQPRTQIESITLSSAATPAVEAGRAAPAAPPDLRAAISQAPEHLETAAAVLRAALAAPAPAAPPALRAAISQALEHLEPAAAILRAALDRTPDNQ